MELADLGEFVATPDILQAALTALSEGRLDEARQGCERVLAAEPDNPAALHWAAVIAYQQGAAPDAMFGQIDRAIALDADQRFPQHPRRLLYALGRDLEAAESLPPRHRDQPPGRAGLEQSRQRAAAARPGRGGGELLSPGAGVAPGLISAINNLGIALKREAELDKALICFREAVLHSRTTSTRISIWASSTTSSTDPGGGADFRRGIEIDPDCRRPIAALAQCLHEQGKREEAIALLRDAPAELPDDEDVDFMLRLQFSIDPPAWHIPMINDDERNAAYERALHRAVTPGDLVFEIGTGSGLVAMMAARAGAGRSSPARRCRSWPNRAEKIARNGLSDRITVLSKRSTQLKLGEDLPEKPTSSSRS